MDPGWTDRAFRLDVCSDRRLVTLGGDRAERAALQTEARQLELTAALDDQLSAYQTQQAILAYEEENVGKARESLSISTERFRLGQTNSLEVQQAQSTFEQTLGRRNLVRFNIKQAEVQLRLLAGQL